MRKPLLLTLALVAAGLLPTAAQISVSNDKPVRGDAITITLAKPEPYVVVTYRPNSSLAHSDTLRTTGMATDFQWAPSRAGVVSLSTAGQGSRNVSVRYKGMPGLGIMVLILAGTILLGGAGFAFGLLFRDDGDEEAMEDFLEHRADT
ncbi:MAG: hypothetical protein KDC66_14365 [Phaeodactylibacter sp.]|nr:hypothetical protein [Phaeodactylibacter sp.]MCB9274472.1 hypothetical protein [Lewinellaceae bacterium]